MFWLHCLGVPEHKDKSVSLPLAYFKKVAQKYESKNWLKIYEKKEAWYDTEGW